MTPDTARLVERLCVASRGDFGSPYEFAWPDRLPDDAWCFSPELLSTAGTPVGDALSVEDARRLSFFEAINFFSLNMMEEVATFLEAFRRRLTALFTDRKLPIEWQYATDPFFDGASNPKFLAQMVDPVKTEMVFAGELAIGSINSHRSFFGEAFGIERRGAPAFAGCVGFGLERWLYAFVNHYGAEPERWPPSLWEEA